MDRFFAMVVLLGGSLSVVLMLLAFFSVAPIFCSCLLSLIYSLYLFIAYEGSEWHNAQEFENRFWTVAAMLFGAAVFFTRDSPLPVGRWSPTLGVVGVVVIGYVMHLWDRYSHRESISRQPTLRRRSTATSSLVRLRDLGIPVEDQLQHINASLNDIDQVFIPSTINNLFNLRRVLSKEREIIAVFRDCDARALNYLISHVKLGLLFYKIKDHAKFNGMHRTELINLLAIERLPILTVISRVILLHSLQLLKLRANPRAEHWVKNIIQNTRQRNLSDLKTLSDAKGDYFCMNKLLYDDIKSDSTRQDILNHIRKEAAVQQTHLRMGTRRGQPERPMQMRKVLSDVDDTLYCSGGMYPAGVDKRYPKKTVYPGVLAFYRELDLGTRGPEEWVEEHVGNLVFLSARPHLYKDISEKANFAKFEKLKAVGQDGRKGLHTTPSLLAGDLASGSQYIVTNDFEPLARKKFENFKRYASIYPEFDHVFVCDNGQGDVRAGEMMFDGFPYEFSTMYVHVVQERSTTYGYNPERWRQKEFFPFFFHTYPEAALHAATRKPPLIRISGLRRICQDAVKDFMQIQNWQSEVVKAERRLELNQAVWEANKFLTWHNEDPVELIQAEQRWEQGQKVRTPYGIAWIRRFDANFDMYEVELDWRPIHVQLAEHIEEVQNAKIQPRTGVLTKRASGSLATVLETDEHEEESTLRLAVSRKVQSIGESSAETSARSPLRRAATPGSLLNNESIAPEQTNSTIAMPVAKIELMSNASRHTETTIFAKINGRFISKYTPPILPKVEVKKGSLFTFLSPPDASKEVQFKAGEQYNTPYGPAKVVEFRRRDDTVILDAIGWNARLYVRKSDLKIMSTNLLRSLLRQFSTNEVDKPKFVGFPHDEGTVIATPFGHGIVDRPVQVQKKSLSKYNNSVSTIGISLDEWTLSNGKHPMLYCTVDTAKVWKEKKIDESKNIFSAIETLVSSSRNLLEPFLSQKQAPAETLKLLEQYFKDAAAVSTPYGDGRITGFRGTDGIYEVSLTSWTLSSGKTATAFLKKEEIRHRVAQGCQEGYPVLTNLGLSGTLASIDPTTGVHIVMVSSAGLVCYLQPECVVRPLKAAVGEEALTKYGDGRVTRYDSKNDVYTIALSWEAQLFCKSDTFDRVGDGVQDRDGPFGVNWLLRMLFFSSKTAAPTRSRSNSLASGSQSNRSVL